MLFFVFDRDEARVGMECRKTDGCGVNSVVFLATFDERLDHVRRNKFHVMTRIADDARPMMRCAASFEHDLTPLEFPEE
ncbi:hypothetical protein SXCC_00366 [Gluconacetobacter sp. SXCC-1]|nr:hypothetical protein SXCC_04844 [Gluconacetobacter sp. SXCC-1]EGG78977.1 hypothetical protein SXCC_00366 [Gluconacetobacter sp. SXCC-1]